ncbi:MAG: hypothetical protein HN915_05170 [Candidatus Marinimicrobia bacterium]|jgi:hypothetical protein|nr:hypothetical protein [Candidatus Neomarinimicrobiota bacterium]MBT4068677.1 hypothetical protein [Candidatus Neomarinimicrobiota bacterium]MBT4809190.1 hypothetical protein [Candidatus Neomarinimicrobiota bacterium]MBT5177008.1 hypothetical protein [Candidatus Neomarinimicrobiota bacterium]MBT6417553.1 hypothetical protein [Candidatus Neomarinimicrobiota bacterium]
MNQNPRKLQIRIRNRLTKILIGIFSIFTLSCDFQNPMAFELPTWFFELSFPLVQKKYSLAGMVDNKQIFSTADSIGMQLMFEGALPDTSIGADILEVELNQNIQYSQDPVTAPSLSFSLDTTINLAIPIAPGGQLTNSSGAVFSVPPITNQIVTQAVWNAIASAVDTTIQITIPIPAIPSSQLPSFIKSVDGLVIKADAGSSVSDFGSTFNNKGLPTNVTNPSAALVTDIASPAKTLANHTQSTLPKDASYGPTTTSLSQDSLGNAIRMDIGFGIASTSDATVTINAGDSVQVNVAIQLRISGLDSAIVQVDKYELPMSLPAIDFPTDIEIYSGKLKSNSGFEVNEIDIKSISSTYPLNIDFNLNFRNFIPPAGKDSTKIDTVLKKGTTIVKTFNLDGYTFANPAGKDSALSKLSLDISAIMPAQSAKIPLDGSDMGAVSLDVALKKLHFESLEANIIQGFPPTAFSIAGMPLGFSGMAFSDTKLEIEMRNGIRLPVILDFDMIGINQKGDSMKVNALSTLASPTNAGDTTKTIIRLSRDGTTTLKYKSPSSVAYYDSSTVAPKAGETTIVELMSSSPAIFNVESRARIDGRGTLEAGMSIGGKYTMLAPFEVIMAPMTFISVTNTPVQEMDHSNRNRIRSTLQSASLDLTVENKIPTGGELAMLMSNLGFFPLDTTVSALSSFKDSMVVKKNWASSDSVYIVSKCDSLNPKTGNYFIFNVMDDIADCVDGMVYLIKTTGFGMDTVVSYVDTLLKIPLPDPVSFYPATNASVHAGQVKDPGFAVYSSPIPSSRIMLMTNPGQPYMAPRFHLNGSDGKKVYLTTADYIDINSNITFMLSSTGMTSAAPDELVVKYPNGNQNLNKDSEVTIKWKTFGTINTVDLAYFAGTSPDMDKDDGWADITTELANVDSFNWTPSSTTGINSMESSLRDSIRIRIKSTDGKVRDMNGWYFTISHSSGKIRVNSTIAQWGKKSNK